MPMDFCSKMFENDVLINVHNNNIARVTLNNELENAHEN